MIDAGVIGLSASFSYKTTTAAATFSGTSTQIALLAVNSLYSLRLIYLHIMVRRLFMPMATPPLPESLHIPESNLRRQDALRLREPWLETVPLAKTVAEYGLAHLL